ncbi:hypothetical protein [Prevotella sp. AGR2160]|uniref:hypothetical protein n=1 Tax=Prevotella sp. AGR2160 TaxID=1280674 RepID=UPI0003F7196F|nr:hypothetical protein [Prevotella sp. AGR2160]
MDGIIEDIVAYAKKKAKDFGYSDQYELLTEAGRRIDELGMEALKTEYMIEETKGGEE